MFNLIDMPRPLKPARGSPQLFKSVLFDKHFSRIRPWHVLALWLPVCAYFFYRPLAVGVSVAPVIGMFLVGGLVWSLVEYLLHRFFFHLEPGETEFAQKAMFLVHGVHHDYPWDPDRLVIPPSVSALLGFLLYWPTKWIVGAPLHDAVFAGIGAGYLWYDIGHYMWHNMKPRTAVGRYLRAYHLVHHFKTPNARYGVSSPLWDYVFGTTREASESESSTTLSTTKPKGV